MKCPTCGYHSLPGAEACGQCGAVQGVALVRAPVTSARCRVADVYPPRARDRTADVRLGEVARRAAGSRVARAARRWSAAVREAARDRLASGADAGRASAREVLRPWLITSAAVIPGVGQLLGGRLGAGVALLLAAAATTAVVVWAQPPLSTIQVLFLSLAWYSAWDAARHSFPVTAEDDRARVLRSARLGLLSACLVLCALTGGYALAGRWWELWTVNTDQLEPTLVPGDRLIVRRLGEPLRELRRGDVVIGFTNRAYPGIERVLGLAGDRIDYRYPVLWVNGTPLPPDRQPLSPTRRPGLFTTIVPPGSIAVWNRDPGGGGPLLSVLVGHEISGRLVGIYDPPARRRWINGETHAIEQ